MGGLQCAKQVIDNGNALTMHLRCMDASIQLNADHIQPTYDQRDRFMAATEALSKIVAEITAYVEHGAENTKRTDNDKRPKPESSL